MKHQIDEWVLYCQFPNIETLKEQRKRAVILEVLPDVDFHDYRIFIDGEGTIKKVKEATLEAPSGKV